MPPVTSLHLIQYILQTFTSVTLNISKKNISFSQGDLILHSQTVIETVTKLAAIGGKKGVVKVVTQDWYVNYD